ncbi:MAG: TonB-dependent receptor [Pseudomonadota bacterium]
MNTKILKFMPATIGVLGMSLFISTAQAQQQDPELEEVIVTGTKQGLTVQDTVTSVSVYNQQKLEREVLFELDDIFIRTANVASTGFTGSVSIRGIQRNGVGFAGTGNTSNIYINGAPLSDLGTGGIETLWDVAQVEILRGPQSTVQGRNSLAGAIVIQTKKPTYETEGSARIRVGDLGTRQYSAAISTPLVDDQLAVRLAVDHIEFEGDTRYASTNELNLINEGTTYRGSLLWEPKAIDDLSVYVVAERIESFVRDTALASAPAPFGTPEQQAFDPFAGISHSIPQRFDYETDRFVAQVDYGINENWSLVAIGTYEDAINDRVFGNPEDPSQFPDATNALFDAFTDTKSAELRFEYQGEKLSGRFGAYYFEDEAVNDVVASILLRFIIPVFPVDSIADIGANFTTVTDNSAFFGELRYDHDEHWSFELGVRYDEEESLNPGVTGTAEVNPPSCIIAPFIPGIGGFPCAALLPQAQPDLTGATFDAWLPRAAVIYRIDDERSLSFSYQRGYRSGGSFLFADPNQPGATPVLESFGPEFINNYELALRSRWLDNRLTVNANLYYSEWEDQQVSLQGPTGVNDSRTVNVGASELSGLEIEAQYVASDNLELFGTLGISNTKFNDFPYAVDLAGNPIDPLNPQFANLRGNEFQVSPDMTASMGAYYKTDSGYFSDLTISYTDGGFSDVFNLASDAFDSRTITNLRVGYENENWRAFVYANNLFDDRAQTESNYENVNVDNTIERFDTPFVRINKPRVVGAAVEYNF